MEGLRSSEQEAQEIVDAIPQTIAVLSPDMRTPFCRSIRNPPCTDRRGARKETRVVQPYPIRLVNWFMSK